MLVPPRSSCSSSRHRSVVAAPGFPRQPSVDLSIGGVSRLGYTRHKTSLNLRHVPFDGGVATLGKRKMAVAAGIVGAVGGGRMLIERRRGLGGPVFGAGHGGCSAGLDQWALRIDGPTEQKSLLG